MRATLNGVQLGPNSPARTMRLTRSEGDEEQLCDDLVGQIAGTEGIVRFSQAQAAQQTRGIPDRRYRLYGVGLWFEVKAADGKLTMSQHDFLLQELKCDALASCGTLDDLMAVVRVLQEEGTLPARRHCLAAIGRWAAKGYRPERPTKRRRRT